MSERRPKPAFGARPGRAKQAAARSANPRASATSAARSHDERQRLIAERAYLLAEARGFAQGRELEDWLQAEAEVGN